MRVLIVEDDSIALDIADTFLRQRGYQFIDHAPSVHESIDLLAKSRYDIILLDVHLEDGEGTEILDCVPATSNVIFTTYDPAYAVAAFEAHAIDYLLKPIKEKRFDEALQRIEGAKGENTIIIKADLRYHKILTSSIHYAKSNKDYLSLHTDEGIFTFYGRLKNFLVKLHSDNFVQCHRSYIVNLKRVTSYSNSAVYIEQAEIPVSESNRKHVAELFFDSELGN